MFVRWPQLAALRRAAALVLALALAVALASVIPVRAGLPGQPAQDGPFSPMSATATFGPNLVVNPGAEAGAASPDNYVVTGAPGWTQVGNATVIFYEPSSGSFPALTDSGPPARGANLFAGGTNNAASAFTQLIDVRGLAHVTDVSASRFLLSGWLGGFASQDDHALLSARFMNGSLAALDSATAGPVLAADRGSVTGLRRRMTSGLLPVGTRYVAVTLWFTRNEGSYDDGYADSIAFVLQTAGTAGAPVSATAALHLAVSPNPVTSAAGIDFVLPAPGRARVEVVDASGRRVATLADGEFPSGAQHVRWDAAAGGSGPGVYFVRLTSPQGEATRRLVRLAP